MDNKFVYTEKIETKKFEQCVCCGEVTDVLKSTPISNRKDYVEGCGQLCKKCADKLNCNSLHKS